jgi:hypothetical protein
VANVKNALDVLKDVCPKLRFFRYQAPRLSRRAGRT